ncbi:MAG: hypothetical protein QOF89_538 [Acidobacteriota bacterium]|jgi:hypothetical protein|nr:hypothetical protein [Acidobacteriota bacterium]
MRRIGLGLWLWITVTGTVWPAETPAPAGPPIGLRDDRGEPISSPLEICFRTDLRSDCVALKAGDDFTPPAGWRSLRIEGPDHGPASFQAEDFAPGSDGSPRLRIPRKALLKIEKLPAEPLTVSLYDQEATSFDKPRVKVSGVGPEGVRIPAGELIVSLTSGRKAPDLHRLAVLPGALASLQYQPRPGWSLIVRSSSTRTRQPVEAAVISLEGVQGYDVPNRPAGEQTTGAAGLALFSGLAGRRIDAAVRHEDFLPRKVQGLSAPPGGLAWREIALEEGGRIRARVRTRGQAREGAQCRMIDLRSPVSANAETWKPQVLYEGRADRNGICLTGRVHAGTYHLSVRLGEGRAALERDVVVAEGLDTDEELSFSEIKVRGTVTRGDRPAPGLTISVLESQEDPQTIMEVARAKSGEEGGYEVALAKPGRYTFWLHTSPEAPPIAERSERVEEDGETTVDFSLETATVHGKVVDEEGQPIEAARVKLRWNVSTETFQRTDPQGKFEFFLEGPGHGEVTARKKGYRESPFQEVDLKDETELAPLVVVLTREKPFRGTLSSAAGQPVAGGWVGSMRGYYGDEPIRFSNGRTDAAGQFEVPVVDGGPNRLFASGPGCPLSIFEPLDANGELALRCQGQPATLDVTLTDAAGRPVPNASILLRRGNVIIPRTLLFQHLLFLGVRPETDASGRIVMPNLAPGDYDVFVADPVSEGMIEAGSRTGYLTSTRLSPLTTTELQLTAGAPPQP